MSIIISILFGFYGKQLQTGSLRKSRLCAILMNLNLVKTSRKPGEIILKNRRPSDMDSSI
ncbi:hypothetical cytosolic protein [Syntrophus aciditrophicus SB]|uniref:Hypothetical cytosolic protein n=1 Tax=Syntrophus aciditrophicus (strain SB) TaxID=56780 RepID=Q2LUH9_SYNAS|nr:hypothetical cytosolic protein [Syntrophus aciditrophicus SB]